MKIIKQMVVTIYADGTTKCTERGLPQKDVSNGRYISKKPNPQDNTPVFPEFAGEFAGIVNK